MDTEHNYNDDPLRNPGVDYERADLSARGVLMFLIGLFVVGVFILIVIGGMFRFLSKAPFFAQGETSPMLKTQEAPKRWSPLENTSPASTNVFPEPRLQLNDQADMSNFLTAEQEVLYPKQPFKDDSGAIHISITDAMKLIEERGLPVRPNGPPPDINTQTQAGNTKILQEEWTIYTNTPSNENNAPAAEPKKPAKPAGAKE